MQLRNPTLAQQAQISVMRGYEVRFTAYHFVLFPIELGCVIVAKLLVLRRLQLFTLIDSPRKRHEDGAAAGERLMPQLKKRHANSFESKLTKEPTQ